MSLMLPLAPVITDVPLLDLARAAFHAAGKTTAAVLLDRPVSLVQYRDTDSRHPGDLVPVLGTVLAPLPRVTTVTARRVLYEREVRILQAGYIVEETVFGHNSDPWAGSLTDADEARRFLAQITADDDTRGALWERLWGETQAVLLLPPHREAWTCLASYLMANPEPLPGHMATMLVERVVARVTGNAEAV